MLRTTSNSFAHKSFGEVDREKEQFIQQLACSTSFSTSFRSSNNFFLISDWDEYGEKSRTRKWGRHILFHWFCISANESQANNRKLISIRVIFKTVFCALLFLLLNVLLFFVCGNSPYRQFSWYLNYILVYFVCVFQDKKFGVPSTREPVFVLIHSILILLCVRCLIHWFRDGLCHIDQIDSFCFFFMGFHS